MKHRAVHQARTVEYDLHKITSHNQLGRALSGDPSPLTAAAPIPIRNHP
jgi:hypothetical protein